MNSIWDSLFGKLLLVVAVVWTGFFLYVNAPKDLPKKLKEEKKLSQVRVKLDKDILRLEKDENWMPGGEGRDYLGNMKTVFVAEKRIVAFQPVDLELPSIPVPPPPQLLPDPGPGLQGATNLPKWGEVLPPLFDAKSAKSYSSGEFRFK